MVLILIAGGPLGYIEFLGAAPNGPGGGFSDPSNWNIHFQSGRSKILERETLRIIVISQKRFGLYSDGRKVEIAGHTLRGKGRIFLVDDKGQLTETNAPLFNQLWKHHKNIHGHISGTLKGDERYKKKHWIRGYLRSQTDKSVWDEPLKAFLAETP